MPASRRKSVVPRILHPQFICDFYGSFMATDWAHSPNGLLPNWLRITNGHGTRVRPIAPLPLFEFRSLFEHA